MQRKGRLTSVVGSRVRILGDAEEDFLEARVGDAVAGNVELSQRWIQRAEQLLEAALLRLVERQDVVQFVIRLGF